MVVECLPAVLDDHILHDKSFHCFGFVLPQADDLDAFVHERIWFVRGAVLAVHGKSLKKQNDHVIVSQGSTTKNQNVKLVLKR